MSESNAQLADRFLQRTAIGVTVMAIVYTVSAATHFVSEDTSKILDKVLFVLSITAVVVVLPIFARYMRLRMSGHFDCSEADGYIASIFNKACVSAFSATFVFLVLLQPVSEKYLSDKPPVLLITVTLAVSLGALGISFFYLTAKDAVDDDDDDDDFDAEG